MICLVNAFGVIAIESWKSKIIDLYSDYGEKNYRRLITHEGNELRNCDLSHCAHHELGNSPRYSVMTTACTVYHSMFLKLKAVQP